MFLFNEKIKEKYVHQNLDQFAKLQLNLWLPYWHYIIILFMKNIKIIL